MIRETILPTSPDQVATRLSLTPSSKKKRLTKVLMDGGSGLNTLYVDTLDTMRITRSELRLVSSPFHGVIPGT